MKRSNFLQALGIGALSTTLLSHNSYSSSLLERLADREMMICLITKLVTFDFQM
ncbi:hypothetical protein [Sphingobacterium populi]|uniref:hypothetical protein n=1 Tax=Sphingobacterium sp. CFCC 11742 TaxID=1775560 RepID=UPI000B33ED0F|nr:hypothetical protein [Sphingobacterium sp. CFCC 11742]